jgi:hypothetical protein
MIGVLVLAANFALLAFRPPDIQAAAAPSQPASQNPIPVMAYYYIWYTSSSWQRGKSDYPLLGRYNSDDASVMEQHVQWAKNAGIDGFIVSWKSTFLLDKSLQQLVEIANREHFHLWIIYQGLDFERNPLPIDQIDADFAYFLQNFADNPAFQMYNRPVMIWSGTWKYSTEEIQSITAKYRSRLLILASEKNVEGYQRLSGSVDGDAYYWSSVNPDTFPSYPEKLASMSEAVHKDGGLWIAPAAPGFDARLIGGAQVVERKNGATLQQELNAALHSNPDAIGLISWNEFSENSQIEPSHNYGTQALDELASIQNGKAPVITDFDSNAPATTDQGSLSKVYILSALVIFIAGSIASIIFRQARLP